MEESTNWLAYVDVFLSPLITIVLFLIGYRLAHQYWLKEKKKERLLGIEQARFESRLAACKAVWGLLAYFSEKENDKTIYVKRGTREKPESCFRRKQAEDFLVQLPQVFYGEGHGLFMSKEVEESIYHFRTNVYRTLDRARFEEVKDELIPLKDEGIMKKVAEIYDFLNSKLREEIARNH